MSGPGFGKKRIKNAVYVHEKGKSMATVTHIDIEGDIGKIIKPGETSFVKGKQGGVFIALKKGIPVSSGFIKSGKGITTETSEY